MNANRQFRVPFVYSVAIAAFVITPGTACSQEPGVRFLVAHAPTISASEPVVVLEPADGQYVYSDRSPEGRARARFPIGKAPRSEYELFSAEEQRGLQSLRDRLLAAQAHPAEADELATRPPRVPRSQAPARHTKHLATACAPATHSGQLEALPWPKVVQDGTCTCVPKLEYADKADWRDHVWCFDNGDGHVR